MGCFLSGVADGKASTAKYQSMRYTQLSAAVAALLLGFASEAPADEGSFDGARASEDRPLGNTGRAPSRPFRLPLDNITVSSGFGLRSGPFDQPHSPALLIGKPTILVAKPSLATSPRRLQTVRQQASSPSTRRSVAPATKSAVRNTVAASPRVGRSLSMHEGVDLVAPLGTPVYAAADGVVVGAAPNGGYGNWIQIQHHDKLATVYGHLTGFAPGVEPGRSVERGDLIGFVGSTGRSTGAHLHFEIRVDGKPVDPMNFCEIQIEELRGPDLRQSGKQVEQSLQDLSREVETVVAKDSNDLVGQ